MIKDKEKKLYIKLYNHYKGLITNGTLPADSKLPSVRRCAQEFGVSKTTVETAYQQLACEGYIQSRPQSGFYVSNVDFTNIRNNFQYDINIHSDDTEILTSESACDFDFALWQRYLKNALHNTERLLGYGHPQGETELRNALCEYLINNREVYCTPDNIIIGAGTQSLLHLLYAICSQPSDIAIIGPTFKQGQAVFEDHRATIHHFEALPEDLNIIKENGISLLYLFPSHADQKGNTMPIFERTRLLRFAQENNIYIAEDDYGSELQQGHIAPSLQGLDAGKCVAYLGTFSKLLLPGIRISYLVLPHELTLQYKERMHLYNQTASKLEQLALSAFIRDGRLEQQIRRTRRRKKSQ